jgi:predicted transcriptional regulator
MVAPSRDNTDDEPRSASIGFRLRPSLKAELERLAREDRRPLSSYIEIALEEYVEAKREIGPGARLRGAKAKR